MPVRSKELDLSRQQNGGQDGTSSLVSIGADATAHAGRSGTDRDGEAALARAARQHLDARRAREKAFPSELFGEPAWDILLELFAAHIESRRVSVDIACDAAASPRGTALRWIDTLEKTGVIRRIGDTTDPDHAFLSLSPAAFEHLKEWVSNTLL